MTFAILDLLNMITLVVAGTIIIFFLTRVRQSIAYLFLAAFVFTYVSGASVPLMSRGGIYTNHPFFIYMPTSLVIFSLPILHVFLKSLSRDVYFKKLAWTFVVPVVVIISQLYFWSLPNTDKLTMLSNGDWSKIFYTYRVIDFVYSLFMIGITLRAVNQYEKNIDQYYSEGLPIGFGWVKTLCYFLLFLMVPLMIPISVYPAGSLPYVAVTITCLGIILLLWVGIAGMNQQFMYLGSPWNEDETSIEIDNETLEAKESSLLNPIISEIKKRQLYRSVTLNLDELAQTLQISPRKLSTLINQESGKNFRNFINGFRVDHAKQQLESGALENMSMNGLARESGFKSRTTFYAAFKSETGSSPLVFLVQKQSDKS